MGNDLESRIERLNEQNNILREQNRILLDAVDVVAMADGIILSLNQGDIAEAIRKTEFIKNNSVAAMEKSFLLNKPLGT